MFRSFALSCLLAVLGVVPALADYDLPKEMSAAIPITDQAKKLGPVIIGDGKMIFADGRTVKLASMKPTQEIKTIASGYFRMDGPPSDYMDGSPVCDMDANIYVLNIIQKISGGAPQTFLVFHGAPDGHFTNSSPTCALLAYAGVKPLRKVTLDPTTRALSYAISPAQESKSTVDEGGGGHGKWIVKRSVNALDETKRVTFVLNADTDDSHSGGIIQFIARCQSNKTEVYVDWGEYLGDDSSSYGKKWKRVTSRIGANKPQTRRWGISTDNEATFAPHWGGDFLKNMLGQDKMAIQVVPYNSNPVTAVFDIRGLDNILSELSETCHWKP